MSLIYKSLSTGEPISKEDLQVGCPELKKLHQVIDTLRIRPDGVLEARVNINDKERWCMVCPKMCRHTVIWNTHQMAHPGINKTTSRIRLLWYWPGLTADVRRIVHNCETCQVAKTGGTAPSKSTQRLNVGRPWQRVAVDLVGPMPLTQRGNCWILVLTDHFTRWQDALALPGATAPIIASTLDERVFCYLGLPESIHSDQGCQFEGQVMQELCALWNVEKTRTTPYHPQGNGVVERGNRALGDSLRAILLNRGPDEWDLVLPQIMRAYRGTPHTTTGETSNLLMLGREVRLPDQLTYPPPCPSNYEQTYVQTQQKVLQDAHQLLRDQQKIIRHQDSEEPNIFVPGDLVLMTNKRRRKGENPKLQARFVGPFVIKQAFNNHTYQIERQGQVTVQNESRLKPYRECHTKEGQAPGTRELALRPNMKGARGRPKKPKITQNTPQNAQTETSNLTNNPNNFTSPTDSNIPPTNEELVPNSLFPRNNEHILTRDNSQGKTPTASSHPLKDNSHATEFGPAQTLTHYYSQNDPTQSTQEVVPPPIRSKRDRKIPNRFGPYICHQVESGGSQNGPPSHNKQSVNNSLTKIRHPCSANQSVSAICPGLANKESYSLEKKAVLQRSLDRQLQELQLQIQATSADIMKSKGKLTIKHSARQLLKDLNELAEGNDFSNLVEKVEIENIEADFGLKNNVVRCAAVKGRVNSTNSPPPALNIPCAKKELKLIAQPNQPFPSQTESNSTVKWQSANGDLFVEEKLLNNCPAQRSCPKLAQTQPRHSNKSFISIIDRTEADSKTHLQTFWISPECGKAILDNTDRVKLVCKKCNFQATDRKQLSDHVSRHFIAYFCGCGKSANTHKTIANHQGDESFLHPHNSPIYEVDAKFYEQFTAYMRWENPPAFPPCVPLVRKKKPLEAPSVQIQTKRRRISLASDTQTRSLNYIIPKKPSSIPLPPDTNPVPPSTSIIEESAEINGPILELYDSSPLPQTPESDPSPQSASRDSTPLRAGTPVPPQPPVSPTKTLPRISSQINNNTINIGHIMPLMSIETQWNTPTQPKTTQPKTTQPKPTQFNPTQLRPEPTPVPAEPVPSSEVPLRIGRITLSEDNPARMTLEEREKKLAEAREYQDRANRADQERRRWQRKANEIYISIGQTE